MNEIVHVRCDGNRDLDLTVAKHSGQDWKLTHAVATEAFIHLFFQREVSGA